MAVAVFGCLDALVWLEVGFDALFISSQLFGRAAPEFAIAHTATGLHHAGGLEIVEMHQHAWRQAVEIADAIRFVSQYAGQPQRLVTHLYLIADLQVQGGEQARFGPGFAWLRAWTWLFWLVGRCCTAKLSA